MKAKVSSCPVLDVSSCFYDRKGRFKDVKGTLGRPKEYGRFGAVLQPPGHTMERRLVI